MKIHSEELYAFVSIVDLGSITLAAERLEQTTSGVSRTLSRLERKLGVTLLRRTTRRIDLTLEGEILLKQARGILAAIEAAEESMNEKSKQPAGLLRIDSNSPYIMHVLVPYMREFTRLYPGIKVEIFSNEQIIDLLEKRIDVALRIGKLEDSTLHSVPLGRSRRRVLTSKRYLKEHGWPQTVEDLDKHVLIGFTEPRHLNYWPLRSADNKDHYVADLHIAVSNGETALKLVKEGAGIACLSDFMTKEDRDKGALIQLFEDQTLDVRENIHAVYYKNTQIPERVKIFIRFLKAKISEAEAIR